MAAPGATRNASRGEAERLGDFFVGEMAEGPACEFIGSEEDGAADDVVPLVPHHPAHRRDEWSAP